MAQRTLTDPIDWVRRQWVKKDLGEPRRFLVMGSLMRLDQLMNAELERTLKPYGLSRNSYMLLVTLHLSERGAALLSQLARSLMVHPTTITLVTDRLEEQRLVTRTAHPTDRRATYATLTPAGRALVREATAALDAVEFGLPGLTLADSQRLLDLISPIRKAAGDEMSPS